MRSAAGPLAVLVALSGFATVSIAQPAAPRRAPDSASKLLAPDQVLPRSPQAKPQQPLEPVMQVRIVRGTQPGCEPACPEWIAAQGRIDHTTLGEFRKVLVRLGKRKLPILINSAGGTVDASFAIGRMIRAKGLDVVVTKTALKPCEPEDSVCRRRSQQGIHQGLPESKLSKCASSCAFILAGGVRRFVGPWTLVGVHEITTHHTLRQVQRVYRVERRLQFGVPVETRRTLVQEKVLQTYRFQVPTEDKTYEQIARYFAEMGVGANIMTLLRSAPSSSIRWLRADDLRSTAMATDHVNGEQLMMPAGVTTAAVAPLARASPPVVKPPAAAACSHEPGSGLAPCATGAVTKETSPGEPSPAAPLAASADVEISPPAATALAPPSPLPAVAAPIPMAPPAAAARAAQQSPVTASASEPARPKAAPKPRSRAAKADNRPPPFSFGQ